mmetsp:Transcript_4724/g.14061  ORF Transcript_4724/g.14061 Transcript_4724/m.14061 type:complete len:96 (-) Transcript_4724:7-294(-)
MEDLAGWLRSRDLIRPSGLLRGDCIAERDIVNTRCRMAGTSLCFLLTMSLNVSRARLLSLGLQCVVYEHGNGGKAMALKIALQPPPCGLHGGCQP